MTHLSDEELFDHARGERDASAHLDACASCRDELGVLEEALRLVSDPFERADPGEGYGARVWTALAPRLAVRRAPHSWGRATRWGGLAAALLLAFQAGRVTAPLAPPVTNAAVRERVLFVAAGRHLERSRFVLAEVRNAVPGEPLRLEGLRQVARELRGEGRLYHATATRDGELGLASVIDELGRVLTEVANAPDELAADDLAALQRRIEAHGLLFKLRVVGRDLERRAGSPVALTSVS